ncbi:MAG: hypothetical protein AAFP99_00915 [Pseudomonadota bacterium]
MSRLLYFLLAIYLSGAVFLFKTLTLELIPDKGWVANLGISENKTFVFSGNAARALLYGHVVVMLAGAFIVFSVVHRKLCQRLGHKYPLPVMWIASYLLMCLAFYVAHVPYLIAKAAYQ